MPYSFARSFYLSTAGSPFRLQIATNEVAAMSFLTRVVFQIRMEWEKISCP